MSVFESEPVPRMSGLGEIYLEGSSGGRRSPWTDRADVVAKTLCHLSRETDQGSVSWLVENPDVATAVSDGLSQVGRYTSY